MDDTIAKVGGVIALAVILFWIWHNGQGTVNILNALGGASQTFITSAEGNSL